MPIDLRHQGVTKIPLSSRAQMYKRREKVTVYLSDICLDVGCPLYKPYVSGGWGRTIDAAAPEVKAVKEARLPWAGGVSGGEPDQAADTAASLALAEAGGWRGTRAGIAARWRQVATGSYDDEVLSRMRL